MTIRLHKNGTWQKYTGGMDPLPMTGLIKMTNIPIKMSAKTKANANYQGALKQEKIANYLLRLSHLPYILRMM